ncbi:phosphatidylethanolamine n-methyltransferase [Fusarium longipes]|uniref:Phosphatidylethanolamine n-methyltransferase n=1 Tax=Fusarium longipes TaxID=694270 RepID=A0A395SA32_9HYPO|nr:phosphatidylethanolamine n-methyltransferase [Fusarium longipes]
MEQQERDTFCAICGTSAHMVTFRSSVLNWENQQWMSKVLIVGQDKHQPEKLRLLSLDARWSSENNYTLFHTTDRVEPGINHVRVYNTRDQHGLLFPIHHDCYDLLSQCARSHGFEQDSFYKTFEAHQNQENTFALDYDYGYASRSQDNEIQRERICGMDYLTMSPTELPRIDSFVNWILAEFKLEHLENLPVASPEPDGTNNSAPKSPSRELENLPLTSSEPNIPKHSTLERLPNEVFCEVLDSLDYEDICTVRLVSKTACKQTTSNGYWKNRFFLDMGWASATFSSTSDNCLSEVDWFKVYRAMRHISQGMYQDEFFMSGPLRNRYRIWNICSAIVEESSLRQLALHQQSNYAVLEDAEDTVASQSRFPSVGGTIECYVGLIHSFPEACTTQPVITVFWSNMGELVGIGTRVSENDTRICNGSPSIVARSKDVQIPKDAWLTEVVITSHGEPNEDNRSIIEREVVGLKFIFSKGDPIQVGDSEGDKQVLFPPPGHFIVGFRLHYSLGQPVSRLGLCSQPIGKVPWDSLRRFDPPVPCDRTDAPKEKQNPEIKSHLWKAELPPEVLDISPACRGYWRYDERTDDKLMETLIFGTEEKDLEMITAIGVDINLQGFEIWLDDGNKTTTRSIGNTNTMQYLSIDGRGGERILFCYVKKNSQIEGIRFVTNWGRQLVTGITDGYSEAMFPSDKESHLMGIYCHWQERNTPRTNLKFIGAFSRKREGLPIAPPTLA